MRESKNYILNTIVDYIDDIVSDEPALVFNYIVVKNGNVVSIQDMHTDKKYSFIDFNKIA
mgnify:CR=1 FL=1